MINSENSKISLLENGNYIITGPDGIKEEVRDTCADKIINEYLDKLEKNDLSKSQTLWWRLVTFFKDLII